MTPPTPPFPPDELLRHGAFLKRLARTLVRDEDDSDDLVQVAWTSALALPPRVGEGGRGLRAWLASVVRNRAANLLRDRERRRGIEARVARPVEDERGPGIDPDDPVGIEQELESQTRVVQAVRALREPYRTAIHLRYYHDLGVREIAARLGVSPATVDSRLVRGRRLLREELTRAFGDRAAWLAFVLPLSSAPLAPTVPGGPSGPSGASHPSGATSAPGPSAAGGAGALGTPHVLGVWVMGTKLKVTALLCLSVLAVGAWRWSAHGEPARPSPGVVLAEPAAELESLPPVEPAPAPDAPVGEVEHRTAVAVERPEPEPEAVAVPRPAGVTVAGQLLDPRGRPLAGRRLRFVPGAEDERDAAAPRGEALDAETGSDGAFAFHGVLGPGAARTQEADLVTVLAGTCRGDGYDPEMIVVAVPTRPLVALIVDEVGAAVPGASVRLTLPERLRPGIDADLTLSSDVPFTAHTDAEGVATIAQAPLVAGTRVRATADGFRAAERIVETADVDSPAPTLTIPLTLVHLDQEREVLRGVVVDEVGVGVPDAAVTYDLLKTRTDAAGRFYLDLTGLEPLSSWLGEEGARHDLTAVRAGYLPAVLRPDLDERGRPVWPESVVLRPVRRALWIAGRVVDPTGEPLEGYVVYLPEAHLLDDHTIEGEIAGDREEFFHKTVTDAQGRFELEGLLERWYDVAALDPRTLCGGRLDRIEAGSDGVEIRVDTEAMYRRVEGRVVDRNGLPIEGARVEPYVSTQTARGAQGVWTISSKREAVTTDADGAFVLEDVPREGVELSVEHPDVMHQADFRIARPAGAATGDDDVLEGLDLVVRLRLSFQVVLEDPGEADGVRVLDERGEDLWLYVQTAERYGVSEDNWELTEGRSKHLFVEEGARTLVLLRGDEEVRRMPLDLEPRRMNVLRP